MGRRRHRKRERQAERGSRYGSRGATDTLFAPGLSIFDDEELFGGGSLVLRHETPEGTACGRCREFVEDQEGGRGTCLHPGSGVLNPWTDTPACPFFNRKR